MFNCNKAIEEIEALLDELEQKKAESYNEEYEALFEKLEKFLSSPDGFYWNLSNNTSEPYTIDDIMLDAFIFLNNNAGRETGLMYEEEYKDDGNDEIFEILKKNGIEISMEHLEYFFKTRGVNPERITMAEEYDDIVPFFNTYFGPSITLDYEEKKAELTERKEQLEEIKKITTCLMLYNKVNSLSHDELVENWKKFFSPDEHVFVDEFGDQIAQLDSKIAEKDSELATYITEKDKLLPGYQKKLKEREALLAEKTKIEEERAKKEKDNALQNDEAKMDFARRLAGKSDDELRSELLATLDELAVTYFNRLLATVARKNKDPLTTMTDSDFDSIREEHKKVGRAVRDSESDIQDIVAQINTTKEYMEVCVQIDLLLHHISNREKALTEEIIKNDAINGKPDYITNYGDRRNKLLDDIHNARYGITKYPFSPFKSKEKQRDEDIARLESELKTLEEEHKLQQAEIDAKIDADEDIASFRIRIYEEKKKFAKIRESDKKNENHVYLYDLDDGDYRRRFVEANPTDMPNWLFPIFHRALKSALKGYEAELAKSKSLLAKAKKAEITTNPLGITMNTPQSEIERMQKDSARLRSAEDLPEYVTEALTTTGEDGRVRVADVGATPDDEFNALVEEKATARKR